MTPTNGKPDTETGDDASQPVFQTQKSPVGGLRRDPSTEQHEEPLEVGGLSDTAMVGVTGKWW